MILYFVKKPKPTQTPNKNWTTKKQNQNKTQKILPPKKTKQKKTKKTPPKLPKNPRKTKKTLKIIPKLIFVQ